MDPQTIITSFCNTHDIDPPQFFTAEEWEIRGEKYCNGAQIIFVDEGGDFHAVVNMLFGSHKLFDELVTALEKHGFYFELGYSWCGGIYYL